ncbi:MAG: TRAP transporter substrate-binding protein [Deltaproteobacteria bacterium]|nr:TRAP transporter substrate-binding protein [Deltaproteobacteria bacterium]
MRKRALGIMGMVLSVLFISSFANAADVIKLKFASYFPPMHQHSVIMDEFTKRLNKDLAGKVEISYHGGGTLLSAPKMAAGLTTGIADIGLSHVGYTRERFPVMEIFGLPIACPSPWIGLHVANDFYAKFKPKEWNDYHPLMFTTSATTIIHTVKKPVHKLEDMKGLKIRATGRLADLTQALGATPVPIGMPDMYESLRKGVVDGTMSNMETLKGWKTGEVIKYATTSWKVGSCDTFYVVMSKKKWDSLPADVQKVISSVTEEYKEKWAVLWNDIDIEGLDFFKKQGGQVIALSDAEIARWTKAAEPVIAGFKKDLVSKGYQDSEVDSWLSYIKERIEYWKGQEKAKKIATVYTY